MNETMQMRQRFRRTLNRRTRAAYHEATGILNQNANDRTDTISEMPGTPGKARTRANLKGNDGNGTRTKQKGRSGTP